MFKNLWLLLRYSRLGETLRFFVPNRLVNLFWHLPLAALATVFFRYPSRRLKVIGVTGTDGKTTTASLIYHLLVGAGKKVALISTISAKIGQKEIPTGFHVTSPHPWKLQVFLRKIADRNYEYVILEVTSHGLAQHRVFGIDFLVGVITNVTREHLDYHKSYEDYLATKAKLLDRAKIAVLNRDDESYEYLESRISNLESRIITYGIKHRADFTPKTFKFKTSLPGEYNRYNCLAAIAVVSSLGISEKKIREAIVSFRGVRGRMEEIDEGQDFKVIVDFAHTPNALENTLKTLKLLVTRYPGLAEDSRLHRSSLLVTVFGCAGLRDREKRLVMGKIAAKYADLIVLTAEDPRTEDVNEIIDQIAGGCLKAGAKLAKLTKKHLRGGPVLSPEFGIRDRAMLADSELRTRKKTTVLSFSEVEKKGKPYFFRIPDRRKAIRFAIQKLARKGDIVAILGKGHEKSMCFGKTEYPWSDQKEARRILRNIKV